MLALEKSNRIYPTDMTDAQWEIICPMLPKEYENWSATFGYYNR